MVAEPSPHLVAMFHNNSKVEVNSNQGFERPYKNIRKKRDISEELMMVLIYKCWQKIVIDVTISYK